MSFERNKEADEKAINKFRKECQDLFELISVNKAVDFADNKAVSVGVNAYVWVEKDGVRDEEPFFSCTYSI